MRTSRALVLALWLALSSGPPVGAQQATEQFIPVGRSPGLAAGGSTIGPIESLDRPAGRLVLAGPDGPIPVVVGETTRIWLDRTLLGQSSEVGSLADCRPGQTLEVRFRKPGQGPLAAWIKIRIEAPRDPG